MSIEIQEITQVVEIDETHIEVVTIGVQGPPGSGSGGGGTTDHGALTGLGDDDHPQYHNDARGDARYYTKTQSDAALAGKSNTGHGHAVADVAGLQAALDAKASTSHSHIIGDVTGLQAALDDKATSAHGHSIGDVSGLQIALDGKLSTSTLALIPKTGQVEVDFGHAAGGESDLASVTVAAAWVTNGSVILCNAAGVATPDHDAEDAALEGITAVAANLNEGVGFDVIACAPLGSWGRFNINIMGV